MADIKKGSDLITTLGDTEQRLKKVERQLAVPRKGVSSIIPDSAAIATSGTPVPIGLGQSPPQDDSVTVVCTANCLVHIYVEVKMVSIISDLATVFLRDQTLSTNTQILVASTTNETRATVAGSNTGVNITTARGGFIVVPITTAGSRKFSLFCLAPAVGAIFSARLLHAFVQPF